MASPRIIYNDLSTITTSASSGTDASFPLTNLQNYVVTSYWKGSSTTNNQWISFDLGSSVSSSAICIDGHNFGTVNADVGITVEGSTTSNFASSTTLVEDMSGFTDDVTFYSTWDTCNYRYIRIKYNSTVPLSFVPRLGNVFISKPLDFTTPYTYGYSTENVEYNTADKTSLSGIKRSSQIYKGRIVYELNFKLQTAAFGALFQTFVKAVRGKMYPFYFVDTDGVTVRYMNLDADYVPTSVTTYGYCNIDLIMKTNMSTY